MPRTGWADLILSSVGARKLGWQTRSSYVVRTRWAGLTGTSAGVRKLACIHAHAQSSVQDRFIGQSQTLQDAESYMTLCAVPGCRSVTIISLMLRWEALALWFLLFDAKET